MKITFVKYEVSHMSQPVLKSMAILHSQDPHRLCFTVLSQSLGLLLPFVFLFGFTQVRFNMTDDVISLYEVG